MAQGERKTAIMVNIADPGRLSALGQTGGHESRVPARVRPLTSTRLALPTSPGLGAAEPAARDHHVEDPDGG
jgi:hypothetical protein